MKKDFTDISVIKIIWYAYMMYHSVRKNNLWYYSYIDVRLHIGFNGGCRRVPKNVFLKRYESINEDEMFKHYEDLKLPAIAYDNDNSEKWGIPISSLQHVGIYKAPKETRFTQKSDRLSMNVEFDKEDKYYLVIRGVERMGVIKK